MRPFGVTAIAVIMLGAGVFLFCAGALAARGTISLMAGAPLLNGLEIMGPLPYFLVASLMTIGAFGLLRLRPWSRRLGILFAAWLLAGEIAPVSSAVITLRTALLLRGGAIIVAAMIVIRYLMDAAIRKAFTAE